MTRIVHSVASNQTTIDAAFQSELAPALLRADRRAAIQAAYGRHRTAGCTVAAGEQSCQIGTDGETHALLARWAEDLADSQDTRPFGTRCGKAMEVDGAMAATGRDAIAAHWDACAARLHALLGALAAAAGPDESPATPEQEAAALAAIDPETGWPGQTG